MTTTRTPAAEDKVSGALLAAARELPMAWLNQSKFPPKKLVLEVFERSICKLSVPEVLDDFRAKSVLIDMQNIISGPDPRSGSFQAQTRLTAARVIDAALRSMPKDV